jgi:hypothetical protein
MPVSDTVPYTSFSASGAATYNFNFKIHDTTDLVVIVAGQGKTLGADFSATIVAEPGEGGTVTFLPGRIPAADSGLVEMKRVLTVDRSTDYQEAGGFRQSVVDKDFDRSVMLTQQLEFSLSRTLRCPAVLPEFPELATPTPNGLLAWNSNGTAIEYLLTAPAYVSTTVSAKSYGNDLSAAIAAIGSANVLLLVDSPITVNNNAATHANTSLVVQKPGMLTVAGGKTLTINGGFSAGLYQIFNGAGAVVFVAGAVADVLPQWWGAKGDGLDASGALNTSAINASLIAAPIGGRVRIVTGNYKLSAGIDYNRQVAVVGDSSGISGYGTLINRIGDFVTWYVHGDVSGKSFIDFGGLDGLTFGGYGGTADVLQMSYTLGGTMLDVTVNTPTSGSGLFLDKVQDMLCARLFLRNTIAGGVTLRGQLRFGPPDTVLTDYCVNDVRFVGCHLEHAVPLVYSDYISGLGRNNTIVFNNTKFESGSVGNIIDLHYSNSLQFDHCRFNQTQTQTFNVANCANLRITGTATSNVIPSTGFGTFTDVDGLTIDINGTNAGKVLATRVWRQRVKVTDSNTSTALVPEYAVDLPGMGLNYLTYFANGFSGNTIAADASEFGGSVIVGNTGDFVPVFYVKPSPVSRHRDGMTFWFRAKSTAVLNYDVRAKAPSGLDVILVNQSVGTTYAWYRALINPDQLATLGMYIQINNNAMSGVNKITISEFYFEEWHSSTIAPASGTWEVGARRRQLTPVVGQPKGWVCTVAGTPGTWVSEGNL